MLTAENAPLTEVFMLLYQVGRVEGGKKMCKNLVFVSKKL
jgi:hypothetical protein